MANLTLVIDDDVLMRARIKALEQGTSVNAVVREHLTSYAHSDTAASALARVVSRASQHAATGRESAGRSWTRDDLYEK